MSDTRKAFKAAESALNFPCDFPIKIMGKANTRLREAVVKVLAEHAPEFDARNLTLNTSKAGNYHALTAVIYAKSKAQLDAIYQALTDHDLILAAL